MTNANAMDLVNLQERRVELREQAKALMRRVEELNAEETRLVANDSRESPRTKRLLLSISQRRDKNGDTNGGMVGQGRGNGMTINIHQPNVRSLTDPQILDAVEREIKRRGKRFMG